MLGAHEARASYLSLPTVVLPLYHLRIYGADYFVFVVSCLVRACVLSRIEICGLGIPMQATRILTIALCIRMRDITQRLEFRREELFPAPRESHLHHAAFISGDEPR